VTDDEGIEGGAQQLCELGVLAINALLCSFLFTSCDGTAVWLYALCSGIADYAVNLHIAVAGLDQAASGGGECSS
jgi:hypothetical protein